MHSKNGNQLWHDLRNGTNHVFGDQDCCNPAFCEAAVNRESDPPESDSHNDSDHDTDYQQPLTEQLKDIIGCEVDDEPIADERMNVTHTDGQTISGES